MASDPNHRIAIQNLCLEALPQRQMSRLSFVGPSDVADYVAGFDERETSLVRGYEVIARTVATDARYVAFRKSQIRQVLDRVRG